MHDKPSLCNGFQRYSNYLKVNVSTKSPLNLEITVGSEAASTALRHCPPPPSHIIMGKLYGLWTFSVYFNFPKYSDTHKHCWHHSKIGLKRFSYRGATEKMANSADPDQTAPLGAV